MLRKNEVNKDMSNIYYWFDSSLLSVMLWNIFLNEMKNAPQNFLEPVGMTFSCFRRLPKT